MLKKYLYFCLIAFLFLKLILVVPVFSEEKVFFASGSGKQKAVAFTFDDGPGANTEMILDILDKYGVKATFFLLGERVEKMPNIAKQILEKGNEIGSHGYNHPNFYTYNEADKTEVLRKDLEKAEKSIEKVLKIKPVLLRMPYGYVKPWVREIVKEFNYKIISWTFGCDWRKMTKDELVKQYTANLKPGSIFLMHDGGGRHPVTVEALPQIIEKVQERGYKIVTISDLLGFGAEGEN